MWTLLKSWSLRIFRTCLNSTYWQNWSSRFLKSDNYWRRTHSLPRENGHMSKFRQGYSSYFLGVWNLAKSYYSVLTNVWAIFEGFAKFSLYFLGLKNFQIFLWSSYFGIRQLNRLNGECTLLKNKIILGFPID